MAWIVEADVENFGGFVSGSPWDDERILRPVAGMPDLFREDDLPLVDFAHCWWGIGLFVITATALELIDKTGLLQVGSVGRDRVLVQVLLQLDLLDRHLSVPSGFGVDSFEGFHLDARADQVAGSVLFRLPDPNSSQLFCGSVWKERYERFAMQGLRFEPAVVG